MNSLKLFILVAGYAHSVLGSYYHGPTAVPHVLKSGYLADTHEVAAAKGAHIAALAKESHYEHGGGYSGAYGHGGDYSGAYGYADAHSYGHGYAPKYHGPIAIPHVLKSGYLADTHEVAAAKGAHLAALAKESHYGHGGDHSAAYGHGGDYYGHGHDLRYHGPTAIPHVLSNGHIADTHEVAAAKAEHYVAVSKAKSHGGYGYAGDYGYNGGYGHGGSYGHGQAHGYDLKYHGPTAIPHVLSNGHLTDTHEVAAAKDEHFVAVSEAKAYGQDHGYSHNYDSHY